MAREPRYMIGMLGHIMAGITEKLKVGKTTLPDVFEVLFFVHLCNTNIGKMCTRESVVHIIM